MKKRTLGIIGGSGLYKMEGFQNTKWIKVNTPWGKPSDEILKAKLNNEIIYFIPRHARGHKINPTNINFRANIDAMKQLGVTDIISVSAVGSLKENLEPGKFVIVDQFIDRTFSRNKTFFDEEIVHVCNELANSGIRVVVAGLDMDFKGNPFGPMPKLMAVAEYVTKVHAICSKTGRLANYSFRKKNNDSLVMLGESEEYEPLSRESFFKAIISDNARKINVTVEEVLPKKPSNRQLK